MSGYEAYFARYPPGFLVAEMVAMLIRAVGSMFAKDESDIPSMAELCPWTAERSPDGLRSGGGYSPAEEAMRRAALAEATEAAFRRWRENRVG